MSDEKTKTVYDTNAARYAALEIPQNARDDLAGFIAALPAGARVLDLGCGPGHSARDMAKAGLNVTAYDFSPEMVRLAAAHLGVSARQAGFDDLTDVATYHGIWASFSLLHAPRAAFLGHLAQIHRALVPGGLFFLAMKLGTGEGYDSLDRFYTYYTTDGLRAHLATAGFTITATRTGEGTGLAGGIDPYIVITAHG